MRQKHSQVYIHGPRASCPAYATGAQIGYLRRLLNQATVLRVESYYIRDWDSILAREASAMISDLKAKIEAAEAAKKPVTQ